MNHPTLEEPRIKAILANLMAGFPTPSSRGAAGRSSR
jgi:hypothetical protein